MQESDHSRIKDFKDVSDLIEEEIRVCDTCGAVGFEDSLAICNKCNDGAEHIYCMSVRLAKVPSEWTCQDCMPREGTNKLVQDESDEAARRSKEGLSEPIKSSKLKSKSPYSRKRTNDASSSSYESHGVPLESQSLKKGSAFGLCVVPPRSSEPCNDSLLPKSKRVKTKSVNAIIYSAMQSSCPSQETANTPVSKSLELKNGDTVKSSAFDLNAYPKDGVKIARVDEVPESNSICKRPSGDRTLVVGESCNAKRGEEKPKVAAVGINLSLCSQNEAPNDGSKLDVGDNVEKPSTILSLTPSAPSIKEENMDLVELQVANTLLLLKRVRF